MRAAGSFGIQTYPQEIHDEAGIMRFADAILTQFRYISRPPSGDFCKEPFENQLIGMNRHLLALPALLICLSAAAQQDPQLTQFYQDRLSFNPAFAGAERLQYVNAFYRDQWNGLETNPQTALFQYSGKPGFIPRRHWTELFPG